MVVVTGRQGGVGATTVAVNLAAVLADRGERVLLVDAAQQRVESGGSRRACDRRCEHSLGRRAGRQVWRGGCDCGGPGGTMLLADVAASLRDAIASRRDSATWRVQQQRLLAELQSLRR